ncbi:MAG: hypothetical protein IKO52_01670, partial [Clostridia bacterium]|nr:hypothetical protein [Clostridia bacterium]
LPLDSQIISEKSMKKISQSRKISEYYALTEVAQSLISQRVEPLLLSRWELYHAGFPFFNLQNAKKRPVFCFKKLSQNHETI